VLIRLLTNKNLITNAIKFTRLEKTRHITVSLGVAFEEPSHNVDGHVSFLHRSGNLAAETLQADWEKGEAVRSLFLVLESC
jgi:signal transduction histidine kinase